MKLEELGYSSTFNAFRIKNGLKKYDVGRIVSQHKSGYSVLTESKTLDAELIGNLRYKIQQRSDLPAVGDWVAISEFDDDRALIHAVYPRKTLLERKAVDQYGEKQVIAANVDTAFIVQAVDRDFNVNRLERYISLCNTANIVPVIIFNKIDLIDENRLSHLKNLVQSRIEDIPFFFISNQLEKGIEEVTASMIPAQTYCLVGSSGVGKSTLINLLSGDDKMKTTHLSDSTGKGKHTTSHRELLVLKNGSIIIDNPGLREVGILDSETGLDSTFQNITALSSTCRYRNCTHTHESGCAIREAVKNGDLDPDTYNNYLKMRKEKDYFESTVLDRRKKGKELSKMVKQMKKVKKDKLF